MYLILEFDEAMLGFDLWATLFKNKREVDAHMIREYGMTYEDLLRSHDEVLAWIENETDSPFPFDEIWIVKTFYGGDVLPFSDRESPQMPVGLFELPIGGPAKLVIGQSRFM